MDSDVEDLVIRARQRDAGAFSALIERFEGGALSVAYGVLRDADRAGDAVQDGFLRAWAELPNLLDVAKFAGWLMQIVRHAAVDVRRRIRPTIADLGDIAAKWGGAAEQAELNDSARLVKEALGELDQTTREAVMLKYYEGQNSREIGEALGMTAAAVDMRISRGRAVLREKLGDLAEEQSAPRSAIGGGA